MKKIKHDDFWETNVIKQIFIFQQMYHASVNKGQAFYSKIIS